MDKYGKLTVLADVESKFYFTKEGYKKERKRVLVRCDCGNEKEVDITPLKSGATKSCGCYRKDNLPIWRIKGHKSLSVKDPTVRKAYRNYKYTAKSKNILFDISYEDFKNYTSKNCEYCGVEPSILIFNETKTKSSFINGIDRVDSKKHYTTDNIKTCCTTCNYAKRLQTEEEFLNWLKRAYEFNNNEKRKIICTQ